MDPELAREIPEPAYLHFRAPPLLPWGAQAPGNPQYLFRAGQAKKKNIYFVSGAHLPPAGGGFSQHTGQGAV